MGSTIDGESSSHTSIFSDRYDIEEIKEFGEDSGTNCCGRLRNGIQPTRLRSRFTLFVTVALLIVISVVVLLAVALSIHHTTDQPSIPPRQSNLQSEVWRAADAKAQIASSNSTRDLLVYFNSEAFRSDIANITALSGATAEGVLSVVREIFLSSPIQHNFPLTGAALDVNLTVMMSEGYVPNYCTAYLQGHLPYSPAAPIQNYAETEIMGFPDFETPLVPTLEEAWTRPQYTCINIYGIAGGCLSFGQMSLVSRPSWVHNMTIISAVDSGLYGSLCLNALNPAASGPSDGIKTFEGMTVNCSAWDGTVGTFQNFDHLLLANTNYYGMSLAWLLQRRLNGANFSDPLFYGSKAVMSYPEGNVAGSLLIPDSVSYVQLALSEVVGQPMGEQARRWASSEGWPLVWVQSKSPSSFVEGAAPAGSGGIGFITDITSIDLTNFFIDPYSARNTTNISISDAELEDSKQVFTTKWNYFASLPINSSTSSDLAYWNRVFTDIWSSVSHHLHLKYSDFYTCADLERCFAIQAITRDCVCRTT